MNGNWRSAWRLITLALLVAVGVLTLAATTWAEDEIKVYAWWNNDPVFVKYSLALSGPSQRQGDRSGLVRV